MTPALDVDGGAVFDASAAWVPEEETRQKILVENPARLYGFPAGEEGTS